MTEQELWQFWEGRECADDVQELKKTRFLPFIGAGMSVNFGYPTWPGFCEMLLNGMHLPLSERGCARC